MCGIAGIMSANGRPVLEDELRAMCAAMIARGPDDEGVYLDRGIGLAMRRLSIIDLQTGHQPVSNEDGSIWVVLNGEIYNFQELREELSKRRSEEHTSELQSRLHLVCRLLLEKKNQTRAEPHPDCQRVSRDSRPCPGYDP